MDTYETIIAVSQILQWPVYYVDIVHCPRWDKEKSPIREKISERYANDPVKQGEFLKHLRASKEDMTTFELLTLDARAWCVAFLKTEGKWKEA